MKEWIKKADVLLEALPYIKKFHNKTVVIKFGGSSMSTDKAVLGILEDIVFMKYVGMKPVLIHGGGPAISDAMKKAGIVPHFIDGQRVTDRATMDIVENVLLHTINKDLVQQINHLGGQAVGLSGLDNRFMEVEKWDLVSGGPDLGYVGMVKKVNTEALKNVLAQSQIPVIAPIGIGPEGLSYNINGDVVAGDIAAALCAEKLVYLTDVAGLLRHVDQPDSLISTIHKQEIEMFIKSGVITGGMIPKAKSCLKALENGAHKTHIIDGRVSHSLLLEIFTNRGIGTEIIP